MTRSVIVLSNESNLFSHVQRVLGADPRFIDGGDSIHCDGNIAPLSNIYAVEMVAAEWEGWDVAASDMPDPRTMSYLIFECGCPEWVAEVGKLLARGLDAPIWFCDSKDAVWPADQVDPERVSLS